MGNEVSIGRIQKDLDSVRQDLIPTEVEGKSFGHSFKKVKDSAIKWTNYAHTGFKVSKEDRAFHKINKLLVKIEGYIKNAKSGDVIENLSQQLESIQEICKTVRSTKEAKIAEGKIKSIESVEKTVKGLNDQLESKKRERLGVHFRQIQIHNISFLEGVNKRTNKEWSRNVEELNSTIEKIKDPNQDIIQLAKKAKDHIKTLFSIASEKLPSDIYKDIDPLLYLDKEKQNKIKDLESKIGFERGQIQINEDKIIIARSNIKNNVDTDNQKRILESAGKAIERWKISIKAYENEIEKLKGGSI